MLVMSSQTTNKKRKSSESLTDIIVPVAQDQLKGEADSQTIEIKLNGFVEDEKHTTTKRPRPNDSKRINPAKGPHKCIICSKIFAYSSKLEMHKRIHSGERPYSCRVCSKTFIDSSKLKVHERIHTGERPYSCKVCSRTFIESGKLKVHERTHSGERPYSCGVCSKTFTQSSSLRTHERIHSGERPYSCRICSKTFTASGNLKDHERTHSGEKPYACKLCSKTFVMSNQLKIHTRTHSGEKPYSCKECSKTFVDSGSLKKHELVHTEERLFQCTICPKTFKRSGELRQHKLEHSGEKPYKCKVCPKAFARSSVLKVHERTHSGEKPYTCGTCSRTFSESGTLAIHKRTHNGEKPLKCPHIHCEFASAYSQSLRQHLTAWHSEEGIKRQKRKEQRLFQTLEKTHGLKFDIKTEREYQIDFKCLDQKDTFARLDALRVTEEMALWLECDENGHEGMIGCDCNRTHKVIGNLRASGFKGKILQIRFNPDSFTVDGTNKKVPYKDRVAKLYEVITQYKLPEGKDAGSVFMYYDAVLDKGENRLVIADDKDFSLHDFVCDVVV